MSNKLIIIGAGGHGKVVADIAIKLNKWESIMFLDDDESIKKSVGIEVIGKTNTAFQNDGEFDFFVAIGNNNIRERIQEKLLNQRLNLVSLIHPSAVLATDVEIGTGTAVMAGVVINSSTRIGKGCIVNTCSSLDHDNVLNDYSHVSPGVTIAGHVSIGNRTWLGIGSVVSNNVTICSDCIVGAGAVVVKDICEAGTYVGVPARRIDK